MAGGKASLNNVDLKCWQFWRTQQQPCLLMKPAQGPNHGTGLLLDCMQARKTSFLDLQNDVLWENAKKRVFSQLNNKFSLSSNQP